MDKYLEEKEIKRIVRILENPIDRFLVAGMYYGLMGNSLENITCLKLKDVDLENRTILANNKTVKLNDYLFEIVKDAIKQDTYIKMGSFDNSNEDYKLNSSSEYIIKPKPNSVNGNGINPIGRKGVGIRFEAISNFVGKKITPSILKQSGAYNCLKSQNKKLTNPKALDVLKKNDLVIRNCYVAEIVKELNKGYDEKC